MILREVTFTITQLQEIIARLQFVLAELERAQKLELKRQRQADGDD